MANTCKTKMFDCVYFDHARGCGKSIGRIYVCLLVQYCDSLGALPSLD